MVWSPIVNALDALASELVVKELVAGGEAHRIVREALGEPGNDWRLAAWNS